MSIGTHMRGAGLRRDEAMTAERIHAFILRFCREHLYSPSLEEIRQGVGVDSTNTVAYHLRKLRNAALVSYEDGLGRTVRAYDERTGEWV